MMKLIDNTRRNLIDRLHENDPTLTELRLVDIDDYWSLKKEDSNELLKKAARRNHTVKSVHIMFDGKNFDVNNDEMLEMMRTIGNLQSLTNLCLIDSFTTISSVAVSIKSATNLRHLDIRKVSLLRPSQIDLYSALRHHPNLENIFFYPTVGFSNPDINWYGEEGLNLNSLLASLSTLPNLKLAHICPETIDNPDYVESLYYSGKQYLDNIKLDLSVKSITLLVQSCPKLMELKIDGQAISNLQDNTAFERCNLIKAFKTNILNYNRLC